ncbi:MAG: DUF3806 domain-containing protein [Candidatus Sumerlaeia bacterium]|nr:DUF3806 domain-containing protein [Candidatus Sumerlaeia bacterium]
MNQKISQLTEQEVAWISSQVGEASNFVGAWSPDDAGQPLSLPALDRAFAAWLESKETDTKTINGVINSVGVAFGQFLVDDAGLSWVIASDEIGTELAVHGLPGKGDILVYPTNFVAKRWERGEANFLEASFEQISRQVQEVAHTHATNPPNKPWWKFW